MDNFEKVEKLRERASVSYEEAKAALEESGWDILDAMVLLEKQGKTNGPQKTSYSTDYDQQEEYTPVTKTVYDEKREKGRAIVLPVLLIGLFLGFQYSFDGKDELKKANDLMNSAGNMAEHIKKEFSEEKAEKEEKEETEAEETVVDAAEETAAEEENNGQE